MSRFFFIGAVILFFLEGVGAHPFPRLEIWGLVCLSVGFLLEGVPIAFPWRKAP